jgi:pyruvate formate lyase activating enzyme
VLVPGYTDDPDEIGAFISIAGTLDNVDRVEILPFHKLGAPKYAQLGIPFPLAHIPHAAPELVVQVRRRLQAGGLPVI